MRCSAGWPKSGLQLLIATSGYDPQTEARQALNLLTRGVDALLLCGCGQSPDLLQRLAQRGVPVVHVMTWPAPPDTGLRGLRQRARDGPGGALPARPGAPPHRHAGRRDAATTTAPRRGWPACARRWRKAGLDLPPARLVERPYGLAAARDGPARAAAGAAARRRRWSAATTCSPSARCSKPSTLGLAVPERAVDRRLRRSRPGPPRAARADHRARAGRGDVAPGGRARDRRAARRRGAAQHRDRGRAGGARLDRAAAAPARRAWAPSAVTSAARTPLGRQVRTVGGARPSGQPFRRFSTPQAGYPARRCLRSRPGGAAPRVARRAGARRRRPASRAPAFRCVRGKRRGRPARRGR